jgi:hypothetical protein
MQPEGFPLSTGKRVYNDKWGFGVESGGGLTLWKYRVGNRVRNRDTEAGAEGEIALNGVGWLAAPGNWNPDAMKKA